MKNLYHILLSSLFILPLLMRAQQMSAPLVPDEISGMEKLHFLKKTAHHPTGLVNNYDLKYHRFQWLVDPPQVSIRGSVTSYFVPTVPNMSSIQFELASVMKADSAQYRGFILGVNQSDNLVTVNFGEILPAGQPDSVTIYYHGDPPGSGFGSFDTISHNGVPALWTLSEPYGASDWWPSKNDLSDKIDSIDVFVAAPKAYKVASNGVMMGIQPYGPNLNVTRWKHRYPIASYLIAIAVTNYAVYTEQFTSAGSNFPIENYVYPEDSAACAVQTGNLLPVYGLFGDLFGNYPYEREKYGHAEFGWGGGMEHQTMTFIGQGAFNISILSHELSHQWFGDMVTCGSWHDIWLNEGFATYCTGLMYEHTSPELYWPIWKYQNVSWVTYYPDGSVYCDDTTNVNRIFDSRLSYSKGAMVLHQLRWIVGDSAFFKGVRSYLEDPLLRYGFALTDDFRAHMEAASGMDLSDYFTKWIYKQGYPSYHVVYTQDQDNAASVTMTQTQSDPSVEFFHLPVPLKFFGEGRDTTLIFDNTFSGQTFTALPGFKIDSVQFDPEYHLISAHNEVALGMPDVAAPGSLVLSPNPAQGVLQISHPFQQLGRVEVTDMTGDRKTILLTGNQPLKASMDVSGFTPGVYVLRITAGKQVLTRKFSVVR